MAKARRISQWDQTANLLAMLVNVNKVKGKPAQPRDFMPDFDGATEESDKISADISVLRDLFVK